eukprot:15457712-Alexandrium_andersonii.AAC.1
MTSWSYERVGVSLFTWQWVLHTRHESKGTIEGEGRWVNNIVWPLRGGHRPPGPPDCRLRREREWPHGGLPRPRTRPRSTSGAPDAL